jgi:hypothetical protein
LQNAVANLFGQDQLGIRLDTQQYVVESQTALLVCAHDVSAAQQVDKTLEQTGVEELRRVQAL